MPEQGLDPIASLPDSRGAGLVRHKSGVYYQVEGTNSGVFAPVADSMRAMPFWLPTRRTIDRIGCEVTVGGEAASVIRFGVYADSANESYPGQLLLDAGTVASNTVGLKEQTISLDVGPGLIWLAMACQLAATTRPTVRQILGSPHQVGTPNGLSAHLAAAYTQGSVAGALPVIFTTTVSTANLGIGIVIRFV